MANDELIVLHAAAIEMQTMRCRISNYHGFEAVLFSITLEIDTRRAGHVDVVTAKQVAVGPGELRALPPHV